MQRRFQFIVALFIIQMVSGMSVTADRSIPLSLNKIIENAGYIFQGECINIRTGRDPETNLLATWFTFRVKQGIKGDLGEEFVLKQYGGSDENYTITPTSVQYEVGEELVLFVYPPSSIGFSSSVGLHQGKFLIKSSKIMKSALSPTVLLQWFSSRGWTRRFQPEIPPELEPRELHS